MDFSCFKDFGPDFSGPNSFGCFKKIAIDLKQQAPPKRGLAIVSISSIANPPAPVGIANAMGAAATAWGGGDHDWRCRYDHAWRHHGAAVIDAPIVTVTAAAAVRSTMKAGSTAAGDRNSQPGLCLFKRRERHGLGGGEAEDTDADHQCERKKSVHLFPP
jgi:hypothetical protein